MNEQVWVFGYGSLVWRPGFSFTSKKIGYIRGWSRRFYQGSTDHRGVPEAPGRVATLLPDPQEICWGVAYCLTEDSLESVFTYLDDREKGGFCRFTSEFYPIEAETTPFPAHVYIAELTNPNYLGPAAMPEMAKQIYNCQGPSGTNSEYLFRLADSLREMGVVDQHVFALEKLVRALDTFPARNLLEF